MSARNREDSTEIDEQQVQVKTRASIFDQPKCSKVSLVTAGTMNRMSVTGGLTQSTQHLNNTASATGAKFYKTGAFEQVHLDGQPKCMQPQDLLDKIALKANLKSNQHASESTTVISPSSVTGLSLRSKRQRWGAAGAGTLQSLIPEMQKTTYSGAIELATAITRNENKYQTQRPKTSKNRFSTLLGRNDLMSPIARNPNDNIFSVTHAGEALAVMNRQMTAGASSGALLSGTIRLDSANATSRKSGGVKKNLKKQEELLASLQEATRRQASDYIKESLELVTKGEKPNDTFVFKPDVPGLGLQEQSITAPIKPQYSTGHSATTSETSFVDDPNYDGASEDNHKYMPRWKQLQDFGVVEKPLVVVFKNKKKKEKSPEPVRNAGHISTGNVSKRVLQAPTSSNQRSTRR